MKRQVLRCVVLLIGLMFTWTAVQAQPDPVPVYSLVYPFSTWSPTDGINVVTLYNDGSQHVESIRHAFADEVDQRLIAPWWAPDGRTVYLPINIGSAEESLVTQLDAYDVMTRTTRTVATLKTNNPLNYAAFWFYAISPNGRYVWLGTIINSHVQNVMTGAWQDDTTWDSRLLDVTTGTWLAQTECQAFPIGWAGDRAALFEALDCDPQILIFDVPTGQLVHTILLDAHTNDYCCSYEWHAGNADPPYLVGINRNDPADVVKLDLKTGVVSSMNPGTLATPTPPPPVVPPADCTTKCEISYAPNSRALAVLRSATTPPRVELYSTSGLVWSGEYVPDPENHILGRAVGWSVNGTWLFVNEIGMAVEATTGRTVQAPGFRDFVNTSPDERWWVVFANRHDPKGPHQRDSAVLYDSQTGNQLVLGTDDTLRVTFNHFGPDWVYQWSPAVHQD